MAYRDPLQAARARIQALEAELSAMQTKQGSGATSVEEIHSRLRAAELAKAVAEQNLAAERSIHAHELEMLKATQAAQSELAKAQSNQELARCEQERSQLQALLTAEQRLFAAFRDELEEEMAVLQRMNREDAVSFYQRRVEQGEQVCQQITQELAGLEGELTDIQSKLAAFAPEATTPETMIERVKAENHLAVTRVRADHKRALLTDASERRDRAKTALSRIGDS